MALVHADLDKNIRFLGPRLDRVLVHYYISCDQERDIYT